MDAGTVFLILVVVVAVALVVRSRSNDDTSAIALSSPPIDTIDTATSFMVSQGYTLTFKGATSATFARPQRPSDTPGCLFLLLGIIPGLLYYGLFKGTLRTTPIATSGPVGTQLAISGDDAQARNSLYRWAQQEAAFDFTSPWSRFLPWYPRSRERRACLPMLREIQTCSARLWMPWRNEPPSQGRASSFGVTSSGM